MNRKNLIARILLSLLTMALFASMAVAQGTATKSAKGSKMA